MDNYSKIRNPGYQIEIARAERVGLMAAAMAADNAMAWGFLEQSFRSPDETPEQALREVRLQDELLRELDRRVGYIVNEAIFNHILCG